MDELQRLIKQLKEFLASSTSSYNKLQACADIIRFMKKSNNVMLQDLCEDYDHEIDVFTKELIQKLMDKLEVSQTESLSEPSGLLSEIGKRGYANLAHLHKLAVMANELDSTGDPELIKEASVLDEILLTLAAPKDAKMVFKQAEEQEIQRLRDKYKDESQNRSYKLPREELEKDLKTADAVKAIENSIKEYRPLEAALSTRTCPDHPGAQMFRITDYISQCSLDKKIYNYQGGFTTMKGNKVPGSDVSNQTQSLGDRAIEHMSFDSRESKLNP